VLMKLKNFKSEDFAKYHPGGKLGRRLLLKVGDLMISRSQCPVLNPRTATIEDVIASLSEYKLGIVLFSEDGAKIDGVLTDGDIRRLLKQHKSRIFEIELNQFINRTFISTDSQKKAVEVLQLMEERKTPLNVLPIIDNNQFVGVVRLHELLSVS
jgi:arabinose-5-phosphate isomerase